MLAYAVTELAKVVEANIKKSEEATNFK